MYKGIKKRIKEQKPIELKKVQDKFQILQEEEVEHNGLISKQIAFKTKEFKADKTINWKDFEIQNLKAAGIDPKSLPTTILPTDVDKIIESASKSEILLDKYEILKELENEYNDESTTEQTQQQEQ